MERIYITTDDKKWSPEDISPAFSGQEVVVMEKMDGENTNIYPDHFHARSIQSKDHPSRHWVKSLWVQIRKDIPDGWRICGENVFAEHSIHYKRLSTYFYVFGIWDQNNWCLTWDDTIDVCENLGLQTVPVLWIGIWNEQKVKSCYTGIS